MGADMVTLKQFADDQGISYEAVRRQVVRYADDLRGHVVRKQHTQYLDDEAVAFLKERFGVREVYTGVVPENSAAKELYRSFGFTETGLFENGMEEMRLKC